MPNFNQVIVMGNLTRPPEIKYTPKGTAVCQFGMAVNRHYTTDNGEKQEETTFVDIEFWGKPAELIEKYVEKGDPLFVEGRLKLDQWDDKATGQKRSKLKIVGETMQFLSGKREGERHSGGEQEERGESRGGGYSGGSSRQRPATRPPTRPPAKPPRDPDLDAPEDDIPFRSAHETSPVLVIARSAVKWFSDAYVKALHLLPVRKRAY